VLACREAGHSEVLASWRAMRLVLAGQALEPNSPHPTKNKTPTPGVGKT